MADSKHFSYEIRYSKAAMKFFQAHEDIKQQYCINIKKVLTGDHPESVDIKRIKGKQNDYYRMRIGGYRVIYAVINGKIVVIDTLLAGSRGDIYKKTDGLK